MYLSFKEEVVRNHNWLMSAGLLEIIFGIIIIYSFYFPPTFAPAILAGLFFFTSILIFIQSSKFWYRKRLGFIVHLASAVFYLGIAGLMALNYWYPIYPMMFCVALVLMLYLAVMGIFRLFVSSEQSLRKGWLWTFYAGLINIICVFYIATCMHKFPYSLLVISTGADIVATGAALLALSLNVKNYTA